MRTVRLRAPPPAGLLTDDVALIVHVSPARVPYHDTVPPSTVSTCGLPDDGSVAGLSGRGALARIESAVAVPASATSSAASCEFSRLESRPTAPLSSATV